jgi:hypothetical protein
MGWLASRGRGGCVAPALPVEGGPGATACARWTKAREKPMLRPRPSPHGLCAWAPRPPARRSASRIALYPIRSHIQLALRISPLAPLSEPSPPPHATAIHTTSTRPAPLPKCNLPKNPEPRTRVPASQKLRASSHAIDPNTGAGSDLVECVCMLLYRFRPASVGLTLSICSHNAPARPRFQFCFEGGPLPPLSLCRSSRLEVHLVDESGEGLKPLFTPSSPRPHRIPIPIPQLLPQCYPYSLSPPCIQELPPRGASRGRIGRGTQAHAGCAALRTRGHHGGEEKYEGGGH